MAITRKPFEKSDTERVFAENRIEFQSRIIKSGHWQTCINCDYFSENQPNGTPQKGHEVCMKFQARPPAYVIANGCIDYIEDIPFD